MRIQMRIAVVVSIAVTLLVVALSAQRSLTQQSQAIKEAIKHARLAGTALDLQNVPPETRKDVVFSTNQTWQRQNSPWTATYQWASEELPDRLAPHGRIFEQSLRENQPRVAQSEQTEIVIVPIAPRGTMSGGFLIFDIDIKTLTSPYAISWWRSGLLAILLFLFVFAITWFITRQMVSHPIKKLLSGIDDVAKGDFSSALLVDQEGELGTIAARFNEMTQSLRTSREETETAIQKRKEMESTLRNTQTLATVGQLAAEIAHEVGTPLNVISGRARSLSQTTTADEDKRKAEVIYEQTSRITRIIQRLLNLTRSQVGQQLSIEFDLNNVVRTVVELFEDQCRSRGIQVRSQLSDSLPQCTGTPDRIQQVVINLYVNAINAMKKGGELTVISRTETRQRPGLANAPARTFVVFEIADTGPGIPADDLPHLFEPFYTSRENEGGTGLGLSVCQGIVKEHDGWIEAANAPNTGARFTFFLPAAEK